MKRTLLCALALTGCATLTPAQKAENVDTTALNTYATLGQILDAREVTKCGVKFCDPGIEKARTMAYGLVQLEHSQYTNGNFAAALNAYQDLATFAKGL